MITVSLKKKSFWNQEFQSFYNPETGIDIDGAWIDMNEPSNVRYEPIVGKSVTDSFSLVL